MSRRTLNVPDWIKIVDAVIPSGTDYWYLKQVEFWDDQRSGGTHHIYTQEPHNPSLHMEVSNGQQTWLVALDKPSKEPAGNFPMWAGNRYSAKLEGASDVIEGMHMPSNHHVSFLLWWERVVKGSGGTSTGGSSPAGGDVGGSGSASPGMSLQQALMKRGEQAVIMKLNAKAALQKAIFRAGFVPISQEFELMHNGIRHIGQTASRLSDEQIRVFYVVYGDWENITWVER